LYFSGIITPVKTIVAKNKFISVSLFVIFLMIEMLFARPANAYFEFSSFTFTSCNTTGRTGPTQLSCRSAYSTSWDENDLYFTVSSGIQLWTVPYSGVYQINAFGAAGSAGNGGTAAGGAGARVQGDFTLSQGDKIRILVGQMGVNTGYNASDGASGSGGGGTYVISGTSGTADSQVLLIAAGGGGSNDPIYQRTNSPGLGGLHTTSGTGDGENSGGSYRGTTAGTSFNGGSFQAGGQGGSYSRGGSTGNGGFGGGGATDDARTGGGGWVGGTASAAATSRNNGSNQVGVSATNTGAGYVTITSLGPSVLSFSSANLITNSTSISYDLNFSQSVTGLAIDDFTLSGTGSATCSLAITGSGTTYSINLSNCSQGTIILTLLANSVANGSSQVGPATSTSASNVVIDQTSPTISTVTAPSNATYKPVDTPTFTVAFSESVTVTGLPRLTLTVGAITRYATYVSQTDSRTALFRYTVTSGTSEFDTDGISISNSIDLNGGSIADLATNALSTLTFSAPNTSSIFVAQPPAAPTIDSATAGSGFIRLNFTAGSTYGSAITNYQYSTNNGLNWTVRSPVDTSTPLTISGLTNGTSYQVRIRAVSAVGTSDSSTSITATPNAVTVAGGSNISTTFGRSDSSTVFTSTGGVGPYVYTLSSSVSGISISNGVVTTSSNLNAGTYSLNVVSTDSYLATGSKAITITVAKARQDTLTITSSAGVFNGNASSLFLMTSGGSDTGTVTFADAGGGTASGCTFSGSTLQVTSAGTCKIVATKAATTNFLIAYSETATITFVQFIFNQPVQTQSVPTQLPINGQNSLDVSQATTVPAVTGVFLVNSTYEINGTGFTGVNRVVIGGSEASIISSTSTKIVIDSAGLMPGPLFIECSDGRIGPSPFYFFAP
jgi:hypothetical protein